MSDSSVVYEMSLKDGLSSKVEAADHKVNHLEHTMERAQERGMEMMESLGISFAVFKGIEFVHEGVEEMEKLHKAEAALQNTMENMGKYSEEAFEKSVKGAKDLSDHILFTQADVLGLQSQLGLVGNIGEEEMGRLKKVSADMATKFGESLGEAGNMLAKAINNPEMARKLGQQLKIDPGVMEHVQNLAKHGKEAEARMTLLAIAEAKVGGAAEAAFKADPMARFNKTMLDLKLDVGDMAIAFEKKLAPALEWVAGAFKGATQFMKEHKKTMELVGDVLLGAGTAVAAIIIATKAWTVVQWGLNAAMLSNPIGLVITGIGVLVGAAIYAYKHFAMFRGIVWATWSVIKEVGSLIRDAFMSVYHVIHGIFTLNWGEVKSGWAEGVSVMSDAAKRIAEAAKKGYQEGMADFGKDQSLIPNTDGKPGKKGADGTVAYTPPPKTKATGSKSVTINVHIKDLIGTNNMNVTNVKESSLSNLKNLVVSVLSGAINDMQVVADH